MIRALLTLLLFAAPLAGQFNPPGRLIQGRPVSTATPNNGDVMTWSASAAKWEPTAPTVAGGIPAGLIMMVVSGACPATYTEVAAMSGRVVRGTIGVNVDVGGTGGSDTLTPAGTNNAPAFTGSSASTSSDTAGTPAGTVAAPAFTGTGSQATSAVTAGTPAGTNASVSITPLGTNGASATSGNCAATNLAIGTGALTACKATAPNLTVTAQTFTGSSTTVGAQTFTGTQLATHSHTITATGTNGAPAFTGSVLATHGHTLTATGTVAAPTFTGAAADNRPAFINVIFCQKN